MSKTNIKYIIILFSAIIFIVVSFYLGKNSATSDNEPETTRVSTSKNEPIDKPGDSESTPDIVRKPAIDDKSRDKTTAVLNGEKFKRYSIPVRSIQRYRKQCEAPSNAVAPSPDSKEGKRRLALRKQKEVKRYNAVVKYLVCNESTAKEWFANIEKSAAAKHPETLKELAALKETILISSENRWKMVLKEKIKSGEKLPAKSASLSSYELSREYWNICGQEKADQVKAFLKKYKWIQI